MLSQIWRNLIKKSFFRCKNSSKKSRSQSLSFMMKIKNNNCLKESNKNTKESNISYLNLIVSLKK